MTLPYSFNFSCPVRIIAGAGALDSLPFELGALGVSKPLVLTRRPSAAQGVLTSLLGALGGIGAVGVCDDIPEHADDSDAAALCRLAVDNGCDGLLALGSGVIADAAKRVKARMDRRGAGPPTPLVVVPGIRNSRGLEASGWIGPDAAGPASTRLMPALVVIDRRALPPAPVAEMALAALSGLVLSVESLLSPDANAMTDMYAGTSLNRLGRFLHAVGRGAVPASERACLAESLAMAGCAATGAGQGPAGRIATGLAAAASVAPALAAAVLLKPAVEAAPPATAQRATYLLWRIGGPNVVADTAPADHWRTAAGIVTRWRDRLLTVTGDAFSHVCSILSDKDRTDEIASAADVPDAAAFLSAAADGCGTIAPGDESDRPLPAAGPEGYCEFGCRVRLAAGEGMLGRIPAMLGELGAARPMVLTDRGVSGAGLADIVVDALGGSGAVGAIEADVPPDSELTVVNTLADRYRESGCDAIVAVGGGSVLDTAKGIDIVVSNADGDLMAYSGAGNLTRPLKPLIAVPTTAGTGSEVTQAAVIADHRKQRKMLFSATVLQPDVAVLDPRMTMTLPPAITAATAMDALTHAVESFYCLAKNPLSDAAAYTAINLICRHLLPVVKTPDDAGGRLALAVAATLAGVAFSNAPVGMVHAMGHSVGSVCGVPHGVCMAIGLPYGLEYNLHKIGPLAGELLLPLAGADVFAATPSADRPEAAVALIRRLNDALHTATDGRHPRCFREVVGADGRPAVPRRRLPEIAQVAMGDGTQVYNPEDLDPDDYLMVLEAAWDGTPLDRSRIRKG